MAEKVIIDVNVNGQKNIEELYKSSAQAKAELAKLQKEIKDLENVLKKATVGSQEYNDALVRATALQNQLQASTQKSKAATNEYNAAMRMATSTTQGMTAAEAELDAAFKAHLSSMYALHNATTNIDAATAKATNTFAAYAAARNQTTQQSGNIVNKQKAENRLIMDMNQLLRESPNFAISARIGLMSLTNNLPILADSIRQAKEAGLGLKDGMNILKNAIFSLNGVLIATSIALAVFSNPAILEWIGSLFKGVKDLTNATSKLTDVNEMLNQSYKSSLTTYSKSIEAIQMTNEVLKLSKEGYIDTNDALNFYNDTLGETFGKTNDLTKAIDLLNKKGMEYIKVMLEMSKAQAFLEVMKETNVEIARLQMALDNIRNSGGFTPEDMFISPSDLKIIFQGNEEEIKKFEEKQNEFIKNTQRIGEMTFEEYKKSSAGLSDLYIANQQFANDDEKQREFLLNSYRTYMSNLQKENQKEITKYYDTILKNAEENFKKQKNNQDINSQNALKRFQEYYDNAIKLAKKYGIDLFKNEKETKDKIDNLDFYSRQDKNVAKLIDITELQNQLDKFRIISVQYTDEQKLIIDEAKKLQDKATTNWRTFYAMSNLDNINYNIKLEESNRKTLENQRKTEKSRLDELNRFVQEETDIYNTDLMAIQKTLNDKEKALNNDYELEAKLKNDIQRLQKEFDATKDIENETQRINEQKRINELAKNADTELRIVEGRITTNEKSIKTYKDELKALEEKKKAIIKAGGDAEEVAEKIAEIDAKIATSSDNLIKSQREKFQEMINIFGEFTDAMGQLFGAIGGMYETNMDITNQNYDLEQRRIEESNKSNTEKEKLLKQLEIDRYNALKKDFERSKKAREAEAWMNMAAGIAGIWSRSYEGGLIAGPILAGIQSAALLLTTINNVRKIRAEKLDAPSGGGISTNSAAKAANNFALAPAETAMTSPTQNLNTQQQIQSYVKVSEINNVQNKVAVREENQKF